MGWTGGSGGGTIPVFGPSGPSHSTGLVPDPGSTAGTTRYLREDTSWVVPSGTGGGMSIGGAITSGTANSVLYVGSGSVLAQDNAAFSWTDSTKTLLAGTMLQQLLNGVPVSALYGVYNSSGNNWFIGNNAGNLSVTGNGNVGVGSAALLALTSGPNNVGIGVSAGQALTTGNGNFALGAGALFTNTTGGANIAIGLQALYSDPGGGASTAVGYHTLYAYASGLGYNLAVGYGAGAALGSGVLNCFIGTYNTVSNWASGSNNTVIGGPAPGYQITSGSYNTLLGGWPGPSGTMSSVIALSDGAGNLLGDYNYTVPGFWTFKNTGGTYALTFATANANFYVATTGNDSNPGTSASPFLTVQHAVNVAASLDYQNLYSPTINIVNGTLTGVAVTLPVLKNCPAGGTIVGNTTTPSSVVLTDNGSAYLFTWAPYANWNFGGFQTAGTYGAFYLNPYATATATSNFNIGGSTVSQIAIVIGWQGFFGTLSRTINVNATALSTGLLFTRGGAILDGATINFPNAITIGGTSGAVLSGDSTGAFIALDSTSFTNATNITMGAGNGGSVMLFNGAKLESEASTPCLVNGSAMSRTNLPGGGRLTMDTMSRFEPDEGFVITDHTNQHPLAVLTASPGNPTTAAVLGLGGSSNIAFYNGSNPLDPAAVLTLQILNYDPVSENNSWPGAMTLFGGGNFPFGAASFNITNSFNVSTVVDAEYGIFDFQHTTNVLTVGTYATGAGVPRKMQLVAGDGVSASGLLYLGMVYNSGGNNWLIGQAGNSTMSGTNNMGMGHAALAALSSGNNNVGVGALALPQATADSNAVAIGGGSLFALNGSSQGNIGVGYNALSALATGNNNTGVGYGAGESITSGSNNTLLGCWHGPSGAMSNVIALSDGAGNLQADYGYTGSGTWTFQGSIYTPHNVYLSTGGYVSYGSGAAIPAVGYESSPGGVAIFDSGTLSNPVVFTVYNNATANWERGIFGWLSNTLTIGSQSTGTGVGRSVAFQAGGNLNNVAPGLININTSFTGSAPGAALTSISNATPAVFTLANHGLFGGQPILLTTTGTLPAPLAINTTYFVDSASLASGTFEVSITYGGAVVNTTTAGSGTHTFTPGGVCTISIGANSTVTFNNHGMVPGQAFKFATTGALPTGITAGTTYYVISSSMTINAFRYSATPNGATITTSGTQSGTQTITLDSATQNQTNTVLALGVSAILNGSISAGHRFTQYWNTTGTPLGALIVNAVNLNSASGGKIFDAQLSSTSYFSVQNVAGNCALVPASSFSLSPGGTSKLDYGITTSSVWSFLAELDLVAGTTTVAPMKFKSGTNLTTPAVGALEFDGKCFYETAVASSRQVSVTEQFQILTAARTFTNNTSAQAIFNATANGAITLAATTTYAFEMVVAASGFSTSAHTINLGFGGTATLTSMSYYYEAQAGTTLAGPNADSSGFMASATAAAIIASATTTGLVLYVRGTIQVSGAGTFIPQLTQVTASAAAVVQIGSFFRAWPLGLNTVTNVGNWS